MATFDHEKLDVYRVALEFVRFTDQIAKSIPTDQRHMRDQILRASTSIPLNIAEGNGKMPFGERRRFFEIARGSAMECAAALDILVACSAVSQASVQDGKELLVRIVSMLTRMSTTRSSSVRELPSDYDNDNEYDDEHELKEH